jgi:REP element-mobilizing transposase RayT
MVHASHVIFGAYGFWLPNDPRGSWSDFVGAWELFRFGPATKTCETRSLAARPHDQAQRLATKAALRRPAVEFSGNQARAIGQGFAEYAARSSVDILACAILPDHIHLVLRRHRLSVEKLVIQLKGAATRRLVDEGVHPFQDRTNSARPAKCFAQGEWKVFLDSEQDIDRAIRYVEKNPLKEGKSRQCWSFVTGCGTAVIARSAGQSRSAARRG